jgi:hypothetical protein
MNFKFQLHNVKSGDMFDVVVHKNIQLSETMLELGIF